jgi:FkbM family methyltransferase
LSWSRATAAHAVDGLCRVFGRRPVVRAARFALNRAKLDLPNEPETNGEQALQRWVLAAAPARGPITVFDVGANVGAWSESLLAQALRSRHSHTLDLHAFEPASTTCAALRERLPSRVRVNQLAVSSSSRESILHVVGPRAGTNSLHESSRHASQPETVRTTTLDDYARHHAIGLIDLLKVDTEGHDFEVLAGAADLFRGKRISVAQFEYNHRWVHARRFLKDVFDLLTPLGYTIGKLTPRGVEAYPRWDPELESFVEGNYLACAPRSSDRIPRVIWWK